MAELTSIPLWTNEYYNLANGLSSDNIHPNDTGHLQIMAAFLSSIFKKIGAEMGSQEEKHCSLPPEYCPHVKQAADEAVKKVFAILGVDIEVPKEVEEFRENLRFGASMRRAAYASLFAAIGTTYGAGDGATTFALPDLRGEFVRGFDDGRGVDVGRSFGSSQAATAASNYAHSDGSVAGALSAICINFSDIDGSGPAVVNANANYYMAAASATDGGAAYAKTSPWARAT